MKKRIFILLAVILVALTAFSSCRKGDDNDDQNETFNIMEKISTAMDAAASYEVEQEINVEASLLDEKMLILGDAQHIYSKDANGELYFYSVINADAKFQEVEHKTSVIEAFKDGQYFFSYAETGSSRKSIRSALTESEFIEYYESYSGDTNLLDNYGEISYVEKDGGGYTVTLKNYNDGAIKDANKTCGLPLESEGSVITDIVVKIEASSEFLINEVKVDYIFSNSEDKGSQKTVFSNYNKARKKTIDETKFTLVEDATAVSILMSLIDDRAESTKGAFTVSYEQKTEHPTSSPHTYKEYYNVSYGVENDKYYFDMQANINNRTQNVSYKNGYFVVNKFVQDPIDDIAAKQYVDTVMDPFSFSPSYMDATSIEKKQDVQGTTYYVIKLAPAKLPVEDTIDSIFNTQAASCESVGATLTFAMKDNKLQYIRYTVTASGPLQGMAEKYKINVTITSETVFKDVTEDEAS